MECAISMFHIVAYGVQSLWIGLAIVKTWG